MKSKLFNSDDYKRCESDIKTFLNSQLSKDLGFTGSVREIGDRLKKILANNLQEIVGDHIKSYRIPSTARAMADFTFVDHDGMKYSVDIITHNEEKKFSMPNITSVERLEKLYEDNKCIFVVLLVDYKPSKQKNFISNVRLLPIEYFSWNCLTIGALGVGQLQIRKASTIVTHIKNSRKDWMREFAETLMLFYAKEISKASRRLTNAAKTLETWKNKDDIWKS